MNLAIAYIGAAQTLFTALIFLLKKPLKIADVILAIWLIAIFCMFGLNIFQEINNIMEDMWFFSLSISITFPPFLYLYAKYVTTEYERFKVNDLLHGIPLILVIQLILIFRNTTSVYEDSIITNPRQLIWLREYVGYFYQLILWVYGILALRKVVVYKKQVKDNYSYNSNNNSLNWLLIVVVSFVLIYNVNIVLSYLKEVKIIAHNVDYLQNIMLLMYVYMIGIWGFQQRQLTSELVPVKLTKSKTDFDEISSDKYKKSGLKIERAKKYLKVLIQFMDEKEAWKDPELSIAKLSSLTNIPKHHITQVLNETLGKNFYVFVNEYRIEYAKKIIVLPEFQSWSIVAIGFESGFNSKTAFNNFFKKQTGLTPSEFKKLAKK